MAAPPPPPPPEPPAAAAAAASGPDRAHRKTEFAALAPKDTSNGTGPQAAAGGGTTPLPPGPAAKANMPKTPPAPPPEGTVATMTKRGGAPVVVLGGKQQVKGTFTFDDSDSDDDVAEGDADTEGERRSITAALSSGATASAPTAAATASAASGTGSARAAESVAKVKADAAAATEASESGPRVRAPRRPKRPTLVHSSSGRRVSDAAGRFSLKVRKAMNSLSDKSLKGDGDGSGGGASSGGTAASGAGSDGFATRPRSKSTPDDQRSAYAGFVRNARHHVLELYRISLRAMATSPSIETEDIESLRLFRSSYAIGGDQHRLALTELGLEASSFDWIFPPGASAGSAASRASRKSSLLSSPSHMSGSFRYKGAGRRPASVSGADLSAGTTGDLLADSSVTGPLHPLDGYRDMLQSLSNNGKRSLAPAAYWRLQSIREEHGLSHNDHLRVLRQLGLRAKWTDLAACTAWPGEGGDAGGRRLSHRLSVSLQQLRHRSASAAGDADGGGSSLLAAAAAVASAASATHAVPTRDPLLVWRRGWLLKKGKTFGRYAKRWFVLLSNLMLLVCSGSRDRDERNYVYAIDLLRCSIDPMLNPDDGDAPKEEDSHTRARKRRFDGPETVAGGMFVVDDVQSRSCCFAIQGAGVKRRLELAARSKADKLEWMAALTLDK